MFGGNRMSLYEKRVNSLASGSNEDCKVPLPAADRMTPSAKNFRRKLYRPRRSSAFPSSSIRTLGTLVSQRVQPITQKCRNMRHTGIQIGASIFNLQTVTLKFGD